MRTRKRVFGDTRNTEILMKNHVNIILSDALSNFVLIDGLVLYLAGCPPSWEVGSRPRNGVVMMMPSSETARRQWPSDDNDENVKGDLPKTISIWNRLRYQPNGVRNAYHPGYRCPVSRGANCFQTRNHLKELLEPNGKRKGKVIFLWNSTMRKTSTPKLLKQKFQYKTLPLPWTKGRHHNPISWRPSKTAKIFVPNPIPPITNESHILITKDTRFTPKSSRGGKKW